MGSVEVGEITGQFHHHNGHGVTSWIVLHSTHFFSGIKTAPRKKLPV